MVGDKWFSISTFALLLGIAVLATPQPPYPGIAARKVITTSLLEGSDKRDLVTKQAARSILTFDGSYAPYKVTCPSNVTWIRPATVSTLYMSSIEVNVIRIGVVRWGADIPQSTKTVLVRPDRHYDGF